MKAQPIILVADDEESILKFFHRVLKKERYTVLTTKEGKEVAKLVNRKRPNLAILDLRIPDLNGIEILRQIKKIDRNIEVIMITAYGTRESARMAMRLGAFDYVTKPFDLNYVKALIRGVLSPPPGSLLQEVRKIRGRGKKTKK